MIRRPPRSTRTDTLFPYTTLFRSHYVRRDAHVLKAEETACTPTARLNIVDDQQRAMRFRNGGDAAQPLRRRGVQTAFALHRFDQYGGRRIQTAGWIGKRSEERRVGKGCVGTGGTRGGRYI